MLIAHDGRQSGDMARTRQRCIACVQTANDAMW